MKRLLCFMISISIIMGVMGINNVFAAENDSSNVIEAEESKNSSGTKKVNSSYAGAVKDVLKVGDYIKLGKDKTGSDIIWRCIGFEKVTGYDNAGNPIVDATDTITEYKEGYLPLIFSCLYWQGGVKDKKLFDARGNNRKGSHGRGATCYCAYCGLHGTAFQNHYDEYGHYIDGDMDYSNWNAVPGCIRMTGGKREKVGSNYWGDSNIRDWLNSRASAGNIVWSCGNPPTCENADVEWHSTTLHREYDQEAGFLHNFSEKEYSVIKTVTHKSIVDIMEYYPGNGMIMSDYIKKQKTSVEDYMNFRLTSKDDTIGINRCKATYKRLPSELTTEKVFLLDVMQFINMSVNLKDFYTNNYEGQNIALRTPAVGITGNETDSAGDDINSKYAVYHSSTEIRVGKAYAKDNQCIINTHSPNWEFVDNSAPAFHIDPNIELFRSNKDSADGSVNNPYSIEPTVLPTTDIKLGDYIKMGNYRGEDVVWRCIGFEKITGEDSKGNPIMDATDTITEYKEGYLPLMVSDKILCFKVFDAPGDNTKGSHGRGYGENRISGETGNCSNYWGDSNLRDWLNSIASAGNVVWSCGNPPSKKYVSIPYDEEAGFLTNFKTNELGAIKQVTQKSILDGYEYSDELDPNYLKNPFGSLEEDGEQNYSTAFSEQCTDKMFPLDVKQALFVANNLKDSYSAKLTKGAIDSKFSDYDTIKPGATWYYWLRTPDTSYEYYSDEDYNASRLVRTMGPFNLEDHDAASMWDVGVRPAFFLNYSSLEMFEEGDGSESTPYTISKDVSYEEEKFSYGDTDGNGNVEAKDASDLLEKILDSRKGVGIQARTTNYREYIDVDKDGYITAKDASLILNKALNSDFKLPVEK